MASMEELHNEELAQVASGWGFDKKIPIMLILVVVVQIITTTWGAAKISTNVENYGKKIIKLEDDLEDFIGKSDIKFQNRSQSIEDKKDVRRELDQIKEDIHHLDTRVHSLELKAR